MEKRSEDIPQPGSGKTEAQGGGSQEQLLEQQHQDALGEVGNISLGAAATALSQILNRTVQITAPKVALATLKELRESFPVPCVVVTVHYLKGLEGDNVLIVKKEDALKIAGLMMGMELMVGFQELGELELSAISEAMNQMMGSAATAMSDLFNRPIDISPPKVSYRDLKTDGVELNSLQDDSIIIRIAFRLFVEDLLDSELVQVIPLEYGRRVADSLLASIASEMMGQTAAVPEAEVFGSGAEEEIPLLDGFSPREALSGMAKEDYEKFQLIKDIPVEIRAVLGKARIPLKRVFSALPGEIIPLEKYLGEPVELFANEQLVAKGEVVLVNGHFGVKITAMLNPGFHWEG